MEALSAEALRIIADRFKLLANPTRLMILQHICDEERCVGDLVALTGCKQANVSKQLTLLNQAGLVRRRVDGTHVYYSVSDGSLPELCRIMQEGIRTRQREVLTDLDG